MQPTLVKEITTTGTLPGKFTPLGIQAKDMAHIMGVLTRQYSDPAMAVLREYSANARDEHVALGLNRPIEVSLPNRFDTYLKIKDYGRGMSIDFVENRYSQYGDSTKRDVPGKDIGGFGIGGKAALAYTDSFTLTTVQNGIKGIFVISRDESGAAGVTTMPGSGRKVDEPNYTEIKVPSIGVDDFTAKAEFLFKFWPEGSVLVNGEAPRRHNGIEIDTNIWYSPNESGQSYLVMGGVPYRIAHAQRYLSDNLINRFHFIAEVGIDAADITPSREDLEYTDKTLAVLKEVGAKFAKAFRKMIQDDIDTAPSFPAGYDKWVEWANKVGHSNMGGFTYKGETVPHEVKIEALKWNVGRGRRSSYYYTPPAESKVQALSITDARKVTLITDRLDRGSYTKSRVRLYFAEKGKSMGHVYFVDTKPDANKWVGPWNTVSWKEILTVKPNTTARSAPKFTAINESGYEYDILAEDMKDYDNIVVVSAQRWRELKSNQSYIMAAFKSLGAEFTLVKIPSIRQAKFVAKYDAVSLDKYVVEFIKQQRDQISESAWKKTSLGSDSNSILRKIVKAKITVDDPMVNQLIKLVDTKHDEDKITRINNLASWFSVPFETIDRGDYIVKAYPLLDNLYTWQVDIHEFVIYMNAAYAARKDQND